MRIFGREILCGKDLNESISLKTRQAIRELGMGKEALKECMKHIEEDAESIKEGNFPSTVIAARIYQAGLLTGYSRTQNKIAIAMGVSEGSLRVHFKKMQRRKKTCR